MKRTTMIALAVALSASSMAMIKVGNVQMQYVSWAGRSLNYTFNSTAYHGPVGTLNIRENSVLDHFLCIEIDQHTSTSVLTYEKFLAQGPRGWFAHQIVETPNTDALRDRAAALQLIIWELTHDSSFNFNSGKFRFTQSGGVMNEATSLWNTFQTDTDPNKSKFTYFVYKHGQRQDFIKGAPHPPGSAEPVPEPFTMTLLGLGVAAAIRRKIGKK